MISLASARLFPHHHLGTSGSPRKKPAWILALLAALIPSTANAGTASFDTMHVSTMGGRANSNGIAISSYVYFASGSSLTIRGADGTVTASSSITASAFFGDGGNLSGVGILSATQTFNGANTFVSSLTVQSNGRQIVLSTSTTTNNISISPAGAVTFFPQLHNSSSTAIPSATTSNTTFGPCVAGSTITITTTGGRVELVLIAYMVGSGTSAHANWGISFLQDGQFVRDMTKTAGMASFHFTTSFSPIERTTPFYYLLDAPTAGSHSYCITIRAPDGGSITLENGSAAGNIFYALEIK